MVQRENSIWVLISTPPCTKKGRYIQPPRQFMMKQYKAGDLVFIELKTDEITSHKVQWPGIVQNMLDYNNTVGKVIGNDSNEAALIKLINGANWTYLLEWIRPATPEEIRSLRLICRVKPDVHIEEVIGCE